MIYSLLGSKRKETLVLNISKDYFTKTDRAIILLCTSTQQKVCAHLILVQLSGRIIANIKDTCEKIK